MVQDIPAEYFPEYIKIIFKKILSALLCSICVGVFEYDGGHLVVLVYQKVNSKIVIISDVSGHIE